VGRHAFTDPAAHLVVNLAAAALDRRGYLTRPPAGAGQLREHFEKSATDAAHHAALFVHPGAACHCGSSTGYVVGYLAQPRRGCLVES
jgi:hypothetical protein